ncbi:MAG: MaoC family dehydratase N-terminal domain-containing protein [Reyranellaceae bacterium]
MDQELEKYRQWVGRTQVQEDIAAPFPPRALIATLDARDPAPAKGDPLPPLWHWLYFLEAAPASKIGPDGHPQRGDFLPPVLLPRRMWAGSRLHFQGDIRLGDEIRRESQIVSVEPKTGASGKMVFVGVRHRIFARGEEAVIEEQDIVYRQAPAPGDKPPAPKPAPSGAAWTKSVKADPVLLFRFSALMFIGHRIHYDQPYATGEEAYPGLVVHGPLLGLMQMELARRSSPGKRVKAFEFRAISPVFDTTPFTVNGKPEGNAATTWVARDDGGLAQQGKVTFG